ncbi:MAG: tetratricopeptide repeat protein, partial [Kiritimatiellae bacterium]|nr:tetratricopeptide repeat protein [Kiritimatiellia bacterium]
MRLTAYKKVYIFLTVAACLLSGRVLAVVGEAEPGTPVAGEASALVSGRAALQDGLYDTAADYLQRYVETTSVTNGQAEGVLLWCDALCHLERYDEALLLLDQHGIGVTNPALNAAFTYARASVLSDQEQWDAAQALLEGVPKGVGDAALRGKILRLSIRCNMASGRMEAAMGQYEQFLDEFSDSPDAPRILLDWAASLIRMKQTERARVVIKRIVRDYGASPEAVEARLWDGQLYLDERAPELAMPVLDALTTATNVDQDVRSRAWFAVAQAREQQTNYVGALDALNRAVSNQPNPELEQQSGLLRARLLIQSGEYTNGTELLHRWVALHATVPGASDALLNAAFELLKQKQYEQASTEFQHYLEAFSDAE